MSVSMISRALKRVLKTPILVQRRRSGSSSDDERFDSPTLAPGNNEPCNLCDRDARLQCRACETPWCGEACSLREPDHGTKACATLKRLKSLARALLADGRKEPVNDECPVCLDVIAPAARDRRYFYCCSSYVCTDCAKGLRARSRARRQRSLACPLCRAHAPNDDGERLAALERNLARGDAAAAARLAAAYRHGRYGLSINGAAAFCLYAAAAKRDFPPALVALAQAYRKGSGVARDASRAAYLFSRAVDLNAHPSALVGLGYCRAEGRGVARDAGAAYALFERAAAAGDADGEYNLGVCYEENDGLPTSERGRGELGNLAEARRLWVLAAARGHEGARAALLLGRSDADVAPWSPTPSASPASARAPRKTYRPRLPRLRSP